MIRLLNRQEEVARALLLAPLLVLVSPIFASAQQTGAPAAAAPQTPPRQNPTGFVFPPSYPVRPPGDPEKIAHGKQVFIANCAFCHGSDARGGEAGPNLVRSELVLNDQHSELIRPVVLGGRLAQGMPPIQLADKDIEDIAEFLHAQPLSERGVAPSAPVDILIGDASAGQAYFNGAGKCSTCHSATGDLAGIGGKYEPKALQNLIVSGGGGGRGFGPNPGPQVKVPPTTVTITTANGQKVEGTLVRLDAFFVGIRLDDGWYRSFAIDPSVKVEVHNPLQAHVDSLTRLQDTDIHNLTRYLVTLK